MAGVRNLRNAFCFGNVKEAFAAAFSVEERGVGINGWGANVLFGTNGVIC